MVFLNNVVCVSAVIADLKVGFTWRAATNPAFEEQPFLAGLTWLLRLQMKIAACVLTNSLFFFFR